MNTRLNQFLTAENLTQAEFAKRLGIARAGVSHILSGRNSPSYSFILSLTQHFPALNIEWLLTGKGKMYRDQSADHSQKRGEDDPGMLFPLEYDAETETDASDTPSETAEQQQPQIRQKSPEPAPRVPDSANTYKKIQKIVVFFSDNTFEEYSND